MQYFVVNLLYFYNWLLRINLNLLLVIWIPGVSSLPLNIVLVKVGNCFDCPSIFPLPLSAPLPCDFAVNTHRSNRIHFPYTLVMSLSSRTWWR